MSAGDGCSRSPRRGELRYVVVAYQPDDVLLFGPESHGLPDGLLETIATERRLRIPMQANSRSVNLTNAVSVVVHEASRRVDALYGQLRISCCHCGLPSLSVCSFIAGTGWLTLHGGQVLIAPLGHSAVTAMAAVTCPRVYRTQNAKQPLKAF